MSYDKKDFNAWKIKARGKSKYMRISWDEAADLIAAELKRVGKTYGPGAVLSQADMHCESKHLSPSHGCNNRLLSLLSGYTIQMRILDSWEGCNWGAKPVRGCEPVGEMMPAGNLYPDIAENGELLLFWGCDPETTAHPIQGIYHNEELKLAQKCTGCAHLLDSGTELPRCVDVCPTAAIQFGEKKNLQDHLNGAAGLKPETGCGPNVFYRNIPGKFITGTVSG